MLTRRAALLQIGIPAALAARRVSAQPPPFWETKRAANWRPDEVTTLLTDSPWSRPALVGDSGVIDPRLPGNQWNRIPRKPKSWKVVVRWESAEPIQEAQQVAAGDEFAGYYVICVAGDARITGLLRQNPQLGDRLSALRSNTSLEATSQPPFALVKVEEVSRGSPRLLLYYFLRRPLNLDVGHVWFATRIGRFDVMVKFDIENMLYHGKLAV